jgi:hypothetical protein
MNIYASLVSAPDGHVHEYSSGPVYTTVNGARVWVSDGYSASTREEIVLLALHNAEVKRLTLALAQSKKVLPE